MAADRTFIFRDGRFIPEPIRTPRRILVADSWRLERGAVSGWPHHVARFEHSVTTVLGARPDHEWARLWSGLLDTLRREAARSAFPRISLEQAPGEQPELLLAIRTCPQWRPVTTLACHPGPDPRVAPRTKGPDIARLALVRKAANAAGFDDAILRDEDGALLEATTGSLALWDSQRLVVPDRFPKQLPGVTVRQVVDRAVELGIEVEFRAVGEADLGRGPVWFLNSVHGVSSVTLIRVGGAERAVPQHPELREWQDWWWGTLTPLPTVSVPGVILARADLDRRDRP